jgi:hypothetical protein
MGTLVESGRDNVIAVVPARRRAMSLDFKRISITVKIGDRASVGDRLKSKLQLVQQKIRRTMSNRSTALHERGCPLQGQACDLFT